MNTENNLLEMWQEIREIVGKKIKAYPGEPEDDLIFTVKPHIFRELVDKINLFDGEIKKEISTIMNKTDQIICDYCKGFIPRPDEDFQDEYKVVRTFQKNNPEYRLVWVFRYLKSGTSVVHSCKTKVEEN